MSLIAKSRAIIKKDGKIFLVFDRKAQKYMLPGGTHEKNETMKECFYREIYEELGIYPVIERLVSIREYYNYAGKIALDYWYEVKNVEDYLHVVQEKCSHGHEWLESGFYDIESIDPKSINPSTLPQLLKEIEKKSEWIYYQEI